MENTNKENIAAGLVKEYAQGFILLSKFDNHSLEMSKLKETINYELQFEDALNAIQELKSFLISKNLASDLFGNPKDYSFEGLLKNIIQTFDSQYLYPSIEEQAANLLYLIIKNHPFSDGNKRIAAFLFIWFLEQNKHRFNSKGQLKINDNGLACIALLVAQSDPGEKEFIIKLIANLIRDPEISD